MKRSIIAIAILALFFSSCASQPPQATATASSSSTTASDPYKDRAKELVTGSSGSGTVSGGTAAATGTATTGSTVAETASAPSGSMTAEEQKFVTDYINHLTYMVFVDDTAGIPVDQAKMAVSAANQYLISKLGLTVLDFETIEARKKDREVLTLVETGEAIDVSQAIAMKYNAQVYVKVSFVLNTYSRDGKAYASITLSVKIHDSTTGVMLGDFNYTPKAPGFDYSGSVALATANAIKGGIAEAMPQLTNQTQMLMKNSLSRGILYELILLGTSDYKQVLKFQSALKTRTRDVQQVSYSAKETRINVFAFKGKDDVALAIMEAAEVAGIPDLSAPVIVGNSFTFTIMY